MNQVHSNVLVIEAVDYIKYLGIFITSDLS